MVALQPGPNDWLKADHYAYLRNMSRPAFAWEWLRRTRRYQAAWSHYLASSFSSHAGDPSLFGLVAFENPALSASVARPIWARTVDPSVLVADVLDQDPGPGDAFNLIDFATVSRLLVGRERSEHLLIGDGHRAIRIDIASGTVVGSPSLLAYRIVGHASAKAPIATLQQLACLVDQRHFPSSLFPPERRTVRWILELRVADAVAAGATAQEIAQHLLTSITSARRWRIESYAARRRVQRLIVNARRQTNDFDARDWLGPKVNNSRAQSVKPRARE